jgi:hypothetical protein
MKKSCRLVAVCLTFAAFLFTGFSANSFASSKTRTLKFSNAEKHVQIIVEINGNIDGHTIESVEHLVAGWLEAAHFAVSHTDGAGYLHLHVKLDVTENHHFQVHTDCAEWHEDKEAAVVDAIDEILHHMVIDFIEKYGH